MSSYRQNGGDWPPFPSQNGGEAIPPSYNLALKIGLAAGAVILVLVVLSIAKRVYTEWLWFDQLGFRSVFTTILVTRIWLFLAGALLFAGLLTLNVYLAYRFTRGESLLPIPAATLQWFQRLVNIGVGLGVLFLSIILGLVAANRWEVMIQFLSRVPFGIEEPAFHREVGFYVFTLPLLNAIQGWLLGAVIVILVVTPLVYAVNLSLRGVQFRLTPRMLAHAAGLGAALMFVLALSHFLDIYELVFSGHGVTFGASYTDVHARLPALRLLTAFAAAAGVLFIVSPFAGGLRLMGGAFGLWVAAAIIVGTIYPTFVQRVVVSPNELEREELYISRNIDFTRRAFNLGAVEERLFPIQPGLSQQVVANNPQTIDNIRLWDHRPLRDTYNQIQFFRLYYSFTDIDIDRYNVNGEYKQVALAARELFPENLPGEAQRWVNQRLQFTHGYGLAMSPVTEFTPEGRPRFYIQDIPPTGVFEVEQPEIYYGENTESFVVVNTRLPEFSHPTPEDVPVYTRYQGTGGVLLSSFLRRAVYAWELGDVNILISGQLTPESRVQYRRQIQQRVRTVAPFLMLDQDPYLVIADGRLSWIQDAYTFTDRYPYSTPFRGGFNYVRNSIKVVIDAYDGTLRFFVVDPQDPMVQMYQRAFPVLFEPLDAMPSSLRAHIRYPVDLFSWQAEVFLTYHMQDPKVFFNKEDVWSVPAEVFFGKQQPVEPYYLITKLPGEEQEEFVLLLPFTPKDKPNLVALLVARSDEPHYGELVNFVFPRGQQLDGPSQVEARIDNDPFISQQFTLWGQVGSTVIRGNLLVIPVEDTVLYVEPVYLQSANLNFPELKRVVVASPDRVAMQPTLRDSLAALVGELPPVLVEPPQPDGGVPALPTGAVQEEIDRITAAIQGLREAVDSLESALSRLRELMIGGEP